MSLYQEYIEAKKNLHLKDLSIDDMLKVYKKEIDNIDQENELRKYYIWDYQLLYCNERTMVIDSNTNKRLTHRIKCQNYKYPDIENFEDERKNFYTACLQTEENINFVFRYLDYLVDYGDNKYNFAKQLAEVILKNNWIKDVDNTDECFDYISRLSRVIDILMKFKMNEKYAELEENIMCTFSLFDEMHQYRWILEISKILRGLNRTKTKNIISDEIKKSVRQMLEKGKEQYKSEKNLYLYIDFCNELCEWLRNEKDDNSALNELLLEIGQAYEDETEYQGGEKDKLYKVVFLEKAAKHYANIGKREKLDEMKSKIKEAYRLSHKEFTKQKFELNIPNDLIEREIKRFVKKNITDSFEYFSRVEYFTPKIRDIKDKAKSHQKNSLLNLVSISKISGDRKVFDAKDDSLREKYFVYQEYGINLQMTFSVLYNKIWSKLLEQGLTVDMVIHRITDWKYMSDDNSFMIKKGIERYFEKDYVSAIHILVPRFESSFRDFFSIAGLPTTSLKSASVQHEQNFSDFINNDFVKNFIREDFLFLIKYIMLDDLGYNLRNKVAHGLAEMSLFKKSIADMVIYLFFCLTNYAWPDKDGNEI